MGSDRRADLEMVGDDFKRHAQGHALTVIRDDGLYRHLRFKRPGTMSYYFDLVTWPGHLAYVGDMGHYVFTRVEDMLTFFRGRKPNPSYWSEKCVAVDKHGALEKFSEETFKAAVEEEIKEHIEAYYAAPDEPEDEPAQEREAREKAIQELRNAVTEDVFPRLGDDQDGRAAIAAAMDVTDAKGRRPFATIYEYGMTEWTYGFQWCCHAIPWAISLYDAAGNALPQRSEPEGST